jgi:peptidoglycan/LPS O-acetylase OafA/YrhL
MMHKQGSSQNTGLLHRMEQLDGLRAIAVLMVFYTHFTPWNYQFNLPWGDSGVDLFFVLSGFLITGILLKCRRFIEVDGQSALMTVRRFYARRFLRIFPAYYGMLLVCTILAHGLTSGVSPWLWSYTLNLYRALVNNDWGSPISHLWSLAVEEQFYLVWPLVIILVPKRQLLRVIVFAILVGLAAKLIIALISERSFPAVRYFTLSCLDTLALGALLAYFVEHKGLIAISKSREVKWLLWFSLPMVIVGSILSFADFTPLKLVLPFMFGRTLLFGWLIIKAAQGFSGLAGYVLALPPVTYLGKISYGMYLFHKPIPYFMRTLGVPSDLFHPIVMFFVYTIFAIIIASLSWHFFESPINSLKRWIPYREKSAID